MKSHLLGQSHRIAPLATALALGIFALRPWALASASISFGPDTRIDVQLRHQSTAVRVLSVLERAATANGMSCFHEVDPPGRLLCQFEQPGANAIQSSIGPRIVSISFFYHKDDSSDADPVRQHTIDSVLHHFVNSLRRDHIVQTIVLCDQSKQAAGPVCGGQMLLDQSAER
jgi:hypothetical protein